MARTERMEAAINDQMAKEFYAAYLYLAMAAYFEAESLPGFAHWMRAQNAEEQVHALKLYQYLLDSGAKVELREIPKPPAVFKGPRDVMQQALEHERKVTAAIHKLYELAGEEKDYPAQLALEWFVTEQIEEERTVTDIINRLKHAGDDGAALLMIDHELATRGPEQAE